MNLAAWLLNRFAVADPVIGDLLERHHSGRSTLWLWRQTLLTVAATALAALTRHPALALLAVASGWIFLALFFWLIDPLVRSVDRAFIRLITSDLTAPDFVWWWMRSTVRWTLMWAGLATGFLASGWLVARIGSVAAMSIVVAFAISVSVVTAVALLLDGPVNPDVRMWMTVPLLLVVAPSTAIVVGGLFASRNCSVWSCRNDAR